MIQVKPSECQHLFGPGLPSNSRSLDATPAIWLTRNRTCSRGLKEIPMRRLAFVGMRTCSSEPTYNTGLPRIGQPVCGKRSQIRTPIPLSLRVGGVCLALCVLRDSSSTSKWRNHINRRIDILFHEPMTIADAPAFGALFNLYPDLYRVRVTVRRRRLQRVTVDTITVDSDFGSL